LWPISAVVGAAEADDAEFEFELELELSSPRKNVDPRTDVLKKLIFLGLPLLKYNDAQQPQQVTSQSAADQESSSLLSLGRKVASAQAAPFKNSIMAGEGASCWYGEMQCGVCTAALDEPEKEGPLQESTTVTEFDLESSAEELGLEKYSSYAHRRSALFQAAIKHSVKLWSHVPETWRLEVPSLSFDKAWRAFNALGRRKGVVPLKKREPWQADDLIPQLQSLERPRESVPMPKLMTADCAECRVDDGVMVFLVSSTVSTRFEIVKRTYADFQALDTKLRRAFASPPLNNLVLPALPPDYGGSWRLRFGKIFSSPRKERRQPTTDDRRRKEDNNPLKAAAAAPEDDDDEPSGYEASSSSGYEATSSSSAYEASSSSSSSPSSPLASARKMAGTYLSTVVGALSDLGLYSEDVLDFLAIDEFARRRVHCDDVKLFLRELHDAEADEDARDDYAVAIDWEETWLAFLRSETDYYGPPGPVKNADLAATMAQHAVHRDGDISDEYALHSPAKWHFVTAVYGPADVALKLPRRRGASPRLY